MAKARKIGLRVHFRLESCQQAEPNVKTLTDAKLPTEQYYIKFETTRNDNIDNNDYYCFDKLGSHENLWFLVGLLVRPTSLIINVPIYGFWLNQVAHNYLHDMTGCGRLEK